MNAQRGTTAAETATAGGARWPALLTCGIALLGAAWAQPEVAQAQLPEMTAEQWQADLRHMVEGMEWKHQNLYHSVSRERFGAAVADPERGHSALTAAAAAAEEVPARDRSRTIVTESGIVVHVNEEPVQNRAPSLEISGGVPRLEAALVEAAERGDRATLDHLLKSGVDVNAAVPGDGSPLIAAARAGRLELVKLLLSQGAAIDGGVDGDGNPLIVAAAKGHLDVVRYLLARGADIEAIVPSDENALMQASYWGREDVVRLLIARGADVNSHDGSRTPLNMARRGRHSNIETILRAAGAVQ